MYGVIVMAKASRTDPHKIETNSRNKIQTIIDNHGDALFREISERDYGIDAILELFENGVPTGKFALLQLKATGKTIVPNKRTPDVSVKNISEGNIQYAMQNNIPVILIFTSTQNETGFYYANIQTIVDESTMVALEENSSSTTTLKIPQTNYIIDDISPLITIINQYYE